ncbi:MAG TPA: 50S ribosomal protein L22 [Patescibacteria group bacterium]|nr:50S ribosomal protein L22 [Patescibacteria group bacterium]
MSVKAIAKSVRISPRKVSVVAALVRGRSVEDAITILNHTPRRSALAVRKVIESAKANADHNHNLKPDTLQITAIRVSAGPSIKRYRPASHGRALPFQRRSAHIYVEVDGEARAAKKPVTKPAAKEETK